jgi:hypothetical protein
MKTLSTILILFFSLTFITSCSEDEQLDNLAKKEYCAEKYVTIVEKHNEIETIKYYISTAEGSRKDQLIAWLNEELVIMNDLIKEYKKECSEDVLDILKKY